MTDKSTTPAGEGTTTNILAVAVWFAFICGLGEGLGTVLLSEFLLPKWSIWQPISLELMWIAPLFNMVVFVGVGLGIVALGRVFPRAQDARLSVAVFTFLTVLDWLRVAFGGRIARYAVVTLAAGLTATFLRWFRRRGLLPFWRSSLVRVAALFVLTFLGMEAGGRLQERIATASLPPAPSGCPNILVIVVDTLRADHLSSYGYARPTSPHLDRMAREGVVFENAFSTSSWTTPSHASLLTGLYPHQHGGESLIFPNRWLTIGEALTARGYRTGAFSANKIAFSRSNGFAPGFLHFEDYSRSILDMAARTRCCRILTDRVLRTLGAEDLLTRKRAPDVNQSVLRWIDRDRGKPFFAFLNYLDAHEPYLPPYPYRNSFSKWKSPGGILNSELGRYHVPTPQQVQSEMDAYDGGVAYVDEHIGHLLAELAKRGLGKNTLIAVTSDHGESFGEHGLFLHGSGLYRELIHVPLIFWWPEHVPAGVRVARPVTNAALPSTLLELAGVGGPAAFPGPPLTRLWQAPQVPDEWPDSLSELAHLPWNENWPSYFGWMKSLVSLQWHYIVHEKFGPELYNWQEDPRESKNLATTPEGRILLQQFGERLQKHLGQPGATSGN